MAHSFTLDTQDRIRLERKMIELSFTQPIQRGDEWTVTLYGVDLDIKRAMQSISSVPWVLGLQLIRTHGDAQSVELRFKGRDTWAKLWEQLRFKFRFVQAL
jgi:hypothetical protein